MGVPCTGVSSVDEHRPRNQSNFKGKDPGASSHFLPTHTAEPKLRPRRAPSSSSPGLRTWAQLPRPCILEPEKQMTLGGLILPEPVPGIEKKNKRNKLDNMLIFWTTNAESVTFILQGIASPTSQLSSQGPSSHQAGNTQTSGCFLGSRRTGGEGNVYKPSSNICIFKCS